MQVNIMQSVEDLNRTQKQREGEFALCLNWDMHLLLPSDISAPGSWTFRLRPTYIAGFPGSPACRWQAVGLLSIPSHTSQFPQDISSYAYLYRAHRFCFSGEP